jgi:opacity protein-like surface antigen
MKRNVLALVIAAAVIMAASAVPARGQFYIGVRGGTANQDASRSGGLTDIDFDKDSAFLYGGQIGFKFSLLAIEGVIYKSDYNLLSSDSSIPSEGIEMDSYFYGVNGKLGIPLVVVYPYITVGYGVHTADLAEFGKDSAAAWNAGAGVQVKLGMVALFGELRYTDFTLELDNLDWDFGGLELHFGLNILF